VTRLGGTLRAAIFVVLIVAAATLVPAHACQACGNPDVKSPMVDGARVGVGLLLGVTVMVQGGFVAFFLNLRRRAKRFHDHEIDSEWAVLQRSSKTS
jgi:hypothetical protein